MHRRHIHASDYRRLCPLRWWTWAAMMLKMTMTMVAVDDYSQRRLRTMGSGSGGGGRWRRLRVTLGCSGGGRLRLGEAWEAAERRRSLSWSLCFFFVRPVSRRDPRASSTIG
jgi:hypothetical protein